MKRILCLMIVLIMVAMVCLPVFATSPVENTVQYISRDLYKADVEYVKEYKVIYKSVTKVLGKINNNKVVVTIKDTILNPASTTPFKLVKLDKIPDCKIQITKKKGKELAVIKPTLKIGQNTYEISYKKHKYKVEILVIESNTDEIDENAEKKWVKVERPINNKWRTRIYSGEEPNTKQDLIAGIGGINKHITSLDVFGRAKIILKNSNPQSPNKWYSVKEKLDVGDNTLEKIIKYDPRPKVELECEPCWYKWEFVLNLSKDEEPTTEPTPTPSDDPTTEPSDDPTPSDEPTTSDNPTTEPSDDPIATVSPTPTTNTNYYGDTTLPQTGETNPTAFILIGICIACVGLYGLVRWKIKNMSH